MNTPDTSHARVYFIPVFTKQPRPGLWGAILDRLLGVRLVPNSSPHAGKFVAYVGDRIIVSPNGTTWGALDIPLCGDDA